MIHSEPHPEQIKRKWIKCNKAADEKSIYTIFTATLAVLKREIFLQDICTKRSADAITIIIKLKYFSFCWCTDTSVCSGISHYRHLDGDRRANWNICPADPPTSAELQLLHALRGWNINLPTVMSWRLQLKWLWTDQFIHQQTVERLIKDVTRLCGHILTSEWRAHTDMIYYRINQDAVF